MAPSRPAVSPTFPYYSNYTIPSLSTPNLGCYQFGYLPYYWYTECYKFQYNPTVLTLGSGNVGLGYELNTNLTTSACLGGISSMHTRVGFATSTNNGSSFGAPTMLGNDTCTYLQAIEPSFATSGNSVYSAYIEENQTYNIAADYSYRASPVDAIGFQSSSNNGGTWSTPVSINSSGNLAHPLVAAHGSTVYVLYTQLYNSTSYVDLGGPGGYTYTQAPSLKLLYSTDAGIHWHGPYVIPGQNASSGYMTMGGAIAVNATGTVAVSYFTNNTCVNLAYGYCYDYGTDLHVITSQSNGTSWGTSAIIQRFVGEYSYNYFATYFPMVQSQWLPESSIAFAPGGTTIDVAWVGNIHRSGSYYYSDYETQAVRFATGPSNGVGTWTNSTLQAQNTSGSIDRYYNVALGVSTSGVYVSFIWQNQTYCYTSPCEQPLDESFSDRVDASFDGGATWSGPGVVGVQQTGNCVSCYGSSWAGQTSSVGFTVSGTPVISYALPGPFVFSYNYLNGTYYYNYTYSDSLQVAIPYAGSTANVSVLSSGTLGRPWGFSVQGYPISVATGSSYLLSGVPIHHPIYFVAAPAPGGSEYGQQLSWGASPPVAIFTGNGTEFINYTSVWQFQLNFRPTYPQYIELSTTINSAFYYMYSETYCYFGCYTYSYSTPQPWWVPNGTRLMITGYGTPYPDYWNGTGNGSYTGAGTDANLTFVHYINETAWEGGIGVYNVTFHALGLPATSTYHFTVDSASYSAPGTSVATATGLLTGSHSLGNIWANSSAAGYEYFGTSSPAPPLQVPISPVVNLSFALVDLGAAAGTLSFYASGLSSGSVWHLGFNGSEYSSSTPYINISGEHPGTYPVTGYPVVANNGTAAMTPTDLNGFVTVTTSGSYDVTFTSAYRVDVVSGIGGTVAGHGALWYASGSTASFQAIAQSGYAFGGWTGVGAGSYSGPSSYANFTVNGAITETAAFFPLPESRFNLTFQETGLAPGTWWTVFVGGKGYSTNAPVLVVGSLLPCGTSGGTYPIAVPYAYDNASTLVRYLPTSYTASICTNGATVDTVTFETQYYLTLEATAGGIPVAGVGASSTTQSTWVTNGTSVELSVIILTNYLFLGWNGTGAGSYTGAQQTVGFPMGNPMSELAVFAKKYSPPPATYWVDFHSGTALASGTSWSVLVNNVGYSSNTGDINVTGLLSGTYTILVDTAHSPDGLTQYAALNPPATLNVNANKTTVISFTTSYWVNVEAAYGGTIVSPSPTSQFVRSGGKVQLNASPFEGYNFQGWAGEGTASYTGPISLVNLTITSPVNETASFSPIPPAVTTSSPSSFLAQPMSWILLAIVGLVVGLVVGLLLGRRGGAAPAATSSPPEPWQGESAPSQDPPTTNASSDAEGGGAA